MRKNTSLLLFAVFIGLLGFLVWLRTGSFQFPEGNEAIWFNCGLFTFLIGTFVTEYRFTKPNDVFVNCLTVFASVSTLSHPPLEIWWDALKWLSLICGTTAVFLAWDPGQEAKLRASAIRETIYRLVTALGSAKVIFSLVFILGLLSYFKLGELQSQVFVLIWGVFLLAALLDLPRLARGILIRKTSSREVIGFAHSFLAPSIVYCNAIGLSRPSEHTFVGFSSTSNSDYSAFGIVIGTRFSAYENRSVIALLSSSIDANAFNEKTVITSINEAEKSKLIEVVGESEILASKKIVGTVAAGTNISQLRFEIIGSPNIAAGSLLSVKTAKGDLTYYQVFDGVVEEEVAIRDSSRAFVQGQAEQVGNWDSELGGFETHDWVARERSCIHLVDQEDAVPPHEMKASEKTVGTIPSSKFPANVDLKDLVLYHSAILGVTGSGKSFLTYSLIESCAKQGIKIVCVDPTGDYQRYLANAVMLSQAGALEAFLDSNRMIGILETGRLELHPIRQAYIAANVCLNWCKGHRADDEILIPKAKVLVVLEEAHVLIPEWNFNSEKSLQDIVNKTSQTVLQARKYGLGFLVVSQRTANVVKSVLNQCNTIFSFQAFDETGFEFLKNYMGSFHVHSLPNLKPRHGIVVGKASKSRRGWPE